MAENLKALLHLDSQSLLGFILDQYASSFGLEIWLSIPFGIYQASSAEWGKQNTAKLSIPFGIYHFRVVYPQPYAKQVSQSLLGLSLQLSAYKCSHAVILFDILL